MTYEETDKAKIIWRIVRWVVSIILVLLILVMWGCPQYNVYSQRMSGAAELAKADSNRQIAVREAAARRDSAVMLAQAEVARARGVAEANHIVARGLGGPEGYLRYLYIQAIHENRSNQIIYVPTEAGLPILEAGRLGVAQPAAPAAQ